MTGPDDDERERQRRRQEVSDAEGESLWLLSLNRPKTPKPRPVFETDEEARADEAIAAAQAERFDLHADYFDAMAAASRARHCPATEPTYRPPPRIPLIRHRRTRRAKKEVDRGAARSTEKKTARSKAVSIEDIRSSRQIRVHEATTFGFANHLCNRPLAFAGRWRTTRAADCPITADGQAPGVLEVQLLALLTGKALLARKVAVIAMHRGRDTVDFAGEMRGPRIRVPFASIDDLTAMLGRRSDQHDNILRAKRALQFLCAATVDLKGEGRTVHPLISVEDGPGGRFSVWMSSDWINETKTARGRGVTIMQLSQLMELREPSHLNAFFALAAWGKRLKGSGLVRSLDAFCKWLGICSDRKSKALASIKKAVEAAGNVTGHAYTVKSDQAGDSLKVRIFIPGTRERNLREEVTDRLTGTRHRRPRRSETED